MDKVTLDEKLLRRNGKRFPGGLVLKAHRLLYHSTLDWRVIKKKKVTERWWESDKRCLVTGVPRS